MAKARFSYIPNIPTPGEAELALGTANNPVAGIHLLNAQMERRYALDQYNAAMEQMAAQQAEADKQAGVLEMAKIVANASNPYAQAPLAIQQFPDATDEITKQQLIETQAAQAKNFNQIASGIHSAAQGGVSTGPDPLAAVGLPGNFTTATPLELQKQAMSDANDLEVARIGAGATVAAARERGGSSGTKPKATFTYSDPLSAGTYVLQGGDLSTVQGMAAPLLQGNTPSQTSSVDDADMQNLMAQAQKAATDRGETINPGARPRKITRGGETIIVVPTTAADGTPSEIALRDRAHP